MIAWDIEPDAWGSKHSIGTENCAWMSPASLILQDSR